MSRGNLGAVALCGVASMVTVISQDQAERCADALLHVARAESDARLERRRGVHRYPELTAWPVSGRAALLLAHARAATTPYFLGYLTPLGLIAIQRVHWRCARRYLRLRGHRDAIDRASSAAL